MEDNDAEDDDEDDDELEVSLDGLKKEEPGQGLKKRKVADDDSNKEKAKVAEPRPIAEGDDRAVILSARQEKKLLKAQRKVEKKAEKKKNKTEDSSKKSRKTVHEADKKESQHNDDEAAAQDNVMPSKEADDGENDEGYDVSSSTKDMQPIDVSGLADDQDSIQSSTPASLTFDSPADKPSTESTSTTTSIASEAAPERPSSASGNKKLKVPSDTTELRARLAAKIAALRAARKADGPDGAPIRTRQELIESRRKKEAERKAHKKELRRQAKEAEDKKREEALASARNSPMLSFGGSAPGSPEQEATNFSFGRVAFADGTQMSQDLSYVKDKSGKKKGPSDPKGALAKLEALKKRLAGLDADKRKEVLEKETWLAARRRAEGEKVRNDESLLKKAVKRKEKTKKKSEREWNERTEGVKQAQKQRQQKREENIRKRKETKQAGKAGRKKGGKGGSGPSKKSRPGFEGSGFSGKRK